jgi:uncharacterized protein (DUF952 family)
MCLLTNAQRLQDVARCVKGNPLDQARVAGHHQGMLIYKIFRAEEWAALRSEEETRGAPVDLADGYIHFSTPMQAPETAAMHFEGAEDLFLVAVETDRLGDDLAWEVSRGGEKFPHLYRVLRLDDVVWAQPLPLVDGVHQFPVGAV